MDTINTNFLLLTLGMAAVTYLGRVAGYWFIKTINPNEKTKQFLNLVPGTIFIAMITPQVINGGVQTWIAGAIIFLVTVLTRNLFIALIAGMLVFVGLYYIL